MASEDEIVILGRFRDEVSGGLEMVEHQISKTGHATAELAATSEAAASALDRAAAKGDKFRREMRDLERQLNETTSAELRLLAAEKAAAAVRADPAGATAKDRIKAERELAKARAEVTVATKALARETEGLDNKLRGFGSRLMHAVTGSRLLKAGLIGLGAVGVSGALAGAAQLVSGIGAAAVAGVAGLAPMVGLLGGLPSIVGTLATALMSFKIVSGGIGEAFKAMMTPGTTAAQMSQALNALGPQGALLIGPMQALAQQFKSIRSDMRDAAYPRFAQAMSAAGPAVTVVGAGLTKMAGALGDVAANGARALSSGPWRRDIATIMDRNVTLFRTFASAGGSIANVFRNIAVAAGPMVQMLAEAFRGAMANLATWIQAKRESGALEAFFSRVGRLTLSVGHVLGDFGVGLINIFRGASPLAAGMGESLGAIAEKFRAWTESPAGQQRIHHFFQEMLPVVREIGNAVNTIVGGILKLGENGEAASLLGTFETILKTILAIVSGLAKVNQGIASIPVIGGPLSGAVDTLALAAMFGPTRKAGMWLGKKGLKRFAARGAARAGAAEAGTLATEAGGMAAAEAGGMAAAGAGEAVAGASVAPLLDMGAMGGLMAGEAAIPGVGWAALAITAAAVGIGTLYVKWKPFHNAVNATGSLIKDRYLKSWHESARLWKSMADSASSMGSAISEATPGWVKSAGKTAGGWLSKAWHWAGSQSQFFAGGQTPVNETFSVGELGPELFLTAGTMRVVGGDGPELMRSTTPGLVVPNHAAEPVAQALAAASNALSRGGDGGAMTVPIDLRGSQFIGIEDFERKIKAVAVRAVAEAKREKAERR